jgi:hypothetical protein
MRRKREFNRHFSSAICVAFLGLVIAISTAIAEPGAPIFGILVVTAILAGLTQLGVNYYNKLSWVERSHQDAEREELQKFAQEDAAWEAYERSLKEWEDSFSKPPPPLQTAQIESITPPDRISDDVQKLVEAMKKKS